MHSPMKNLNIFIIAPGYPSGRPGDYRGIFIRNLVHALKNEGHRITIMTSALFKDDLPYLKVDESEEIFRFRFWSEEKPLGEYRRIPVFRMITYLVSAVRCGKRIIRNRSFDILHSHFLVPAGLIGSYLAVKFKIPHLLTVHGREAQISAGNRMIRPIARWTLKRTQSVTVTARHLLDACESIHAPLEPTRQIPMGIRDDFFETLPAEVRREEKETHSIKIISTRTLLEEPYNISQLLHAMVRISGTAPEARLTLVGDGPDREKYENMTRELKLDKVVNFAGWAAPDRMAGLLREHDVYVSTSKFDGASVSLFEAMASGVYPVISDIGANRECVESGCEGVLFPPDEPASLADTLLTAIKDRDSMKRAVEHNRRYAREHFSWPGIAKQFESIYMKLAQ
jgi:glycosyltransferase involved in cell wall biosynthesis